MGQRLARRDMEAGLRLYNEERYSEAIDCWNGALRRLQGGRDKFDALTHLLRAYENVGKYRHMLTGAVQQLDLANEAGDESRRAAAYLNLARSNQYMSEFHKSISYSRHCLQSELRVSPLHGHAYLTLATAYTGLGEFSKALQNYDLTLKIGKDADDASLQLLAYVGLGDLFVSLRDYETCLTSYCHAADLVSSVDSPPMQARYQRLVSQSIAASQWRVGRLTEAMETCEDAMRLALRYGDRRLQARCLLTFADIHRTRNDFGRAYPRFESAHAIMAEVGDRTGQIEALCGLAKSAASTRQPRKAIEQNERALDQGRATGSKLQMLKCHVRLRDLHGWLGEEDRAHQHERLLRHLLDEMELVCDICSQVIGETPEKLEYLSCGHLIHGRCAVHLGRATLRRSGFKRPCPSCRRKSFVDPVMYA